jgi:hypothetical protein
MFQYKKFGREDTNSFWKGAESGPNCLRSAVDGACLPFRHLRCNCLEELEDFNLELVRAEKRACLLHLQFVIFSFSKVLAGSDGAPYRIQFP